MAATDSAKVSSGKVSFSRALEKNYAVVRRQICIVVKRTVPPDLSSAAAVNKTTDIYLINLQLE